MWFLYEYPFLKCPYHQLVSISKPHFLHHISAVGFNGKPTDEKLIGNFLIAIAQGNQL